ncbi:MAG: UDP-N-acetylglucosamine--dolichyl-phosphate N-acetylglucosaminephosphotransferase [Pyrobaculum sp.]
MSIEIVLITFFIGVALGLWWVPYQKKVGLTSRDIYKDLEAVPRAGGVIAMVAATVGFLLTAPHVPYASTVAVVALAIGLIGLVDDVRGVSEYVRVLFPVFLALVVVRAIEEVRLTIPVVGLFYGATGWLSALAIPVMTNAFNMLDPVNGFLPAANIIIGLTLIGVAAVKGTWDAVYLLAIHTAASAALFLYNKYPARTFNGNVGSYYLGASISTIAVIYDLVPYLILTALPFVINGVLIIFSSGGIKSREKIQRPTVLKNGVVYQVCDSPILSLVRVIVSERPMTEFELFKTLTSLVAVASILTIALAALLKTLGAPL